MGRLGAIGAQRVRGRRVRVGVRLPGAAAHLGTKSIAPPVPGLDQPGRLGAVAEGLAQLADRLRQHIGRERLMPPHLVEQGVAVEQGRRPLDQQL